MGNLVPNDEADGSEVHVERSVHFKEDPAKDSCWKLDGVFIRVVEGVDYGCSTMSPPVFLVSEIRGNTDEKSYILIKIFSYVEIFNNIF